MTVVYERRSPGSVTGMVRRYRAGLQRGTVDVPCETCTACCREPQVQLLREEWERFPDAERGEAGERYLPRQEDGSCTRFVDGKCSIYADRPYACRIFDCRVANLLGILLREDEAPRMREAQMQWAEFRRPTVDDEDLFLAIRLSVVEKASRELTVAGKALVDWPSYLERAREVRRGR